MTRTAAGNSGFRQWLFLSVVLKSFGIKIAFEKLNLKSKIMNAISRIPLILVLLLTFPTMSFSQIYNDENEQVIPETTSFYHGQIVLNDMTVVKGLININYRQKERFVTRVKSEGKILYIPNNEILLVTLSSKNNNGVLENSFEKIDVDEKLYRIVGNGKRKIYDESSKPTTNLVGEIFVKEGLNSKSLYNFWSSGPKQDLIDYVNKRDNKDFRKKDFNNVDELIAVATN